jgi:hypothetical protein
MTVSLLATKEGWIFRAIALTWSRVNGFPGAGRRSSAKTRLPQDRRRIKFRPQKAIPFVIIFLILQSPFLVDIYFFDQILYFLNYKIPNIIQSLFR